ncbi:MAG: glycosyltransferase [Bacteroidota bacterium]
MKLAINATTLGSAGGLNVALNFLNEIGHMNLKHKEVHVFAPRDKGYESFESENIHIHTVSDFKRKHFMRLDTDFRWLPQKIESLSPDIIFSMGNLGTPINGIKQALLFHWPYAIYFQEKELWKRMSTKDKLNRQIRRQIFKNRLKYVDMVFPQTNTAAFRLERYYPFINKIIPIPNAYTKLESLRVEDQASFEREKGYKYLLCLSRYYPHKNIESLINVASLIKTQGLPYKIIITLSEDQHPNVKLINEKIIQNGLDDIILNVGRVPIELVPNFYESVDALILPTLLESFSGTYVDAMQFGKPIFTSDKDFAKEVCGELAYYFNPLSPREILKTIVTAYGDENELEERVKRGRQRVAQFPDWTIVAQMYMQELENLYKS